MSRLNGLAIASAILVLTAHAFAKPNRQKPRPLISAANADMVRSVGELKQDIWSIVQVPGRGQLAFVRWEEPVEIVSDADFRPIRKIADGLRPIHFAASKTGRLIAWSGNNTRVVVSDEEVGKSLEIETESAQSRMAFSPDGKVLATGGYGTQVKLWDAGGRLVRALDAGSEGGLTPVFSSDGKFLAVGNRNDQTRLYETSTGKLLHTLPRSMTHELAFSPDGKVLAAAYVDGTVAVWDVAGGELLQSKATGASQVYTLDWSPKGDVLATAGLKGKIVLWEPRKLTALKELDAPEWVIQVRFTQDGSRLLSAGGSEGFGARDRKVVIWAVAPDDNK